MRKTAAALISVAIAAVLWFLLHERLPARMQTDEPHAANRSGTSEFAAPATVTPIPPSLLEIVQRDDVCEFQKIWGNVADDELNRVFTQSADIRPDDDPVDQMLLALARRDPSLARARAAYGKLGPALIRALAWAGFLDGMKGPLDLREARRLLGELAAEDPSNAVFPFFLAAVEEKDGQSAASVRAIERAVREKKFDTFYEDLIRKVREKSMDSATLFLMGIQFNSRLPFPDLYAGSQLVHREIRQGGPEFAQSALEFGQMLMNQYLHQREYCCELEYAMGRSIYLDAWKKLNPGREVPKTAELSEIRRKVGAWARHPELELIASDPDAECKRDVVDRVVHDERLRLRRGAE
jgi:hypothetical protein